MGRVGCSECALRFRFERRVASRSLDQIGDVCAGETEISCSPDLSDPSVVPGAVRQAKYGEYSEKIKLDIECRNPSEGFPSEANVNFYPRRGSKLFSSDASCRL